MTPSEILSRAAELLEARKWGCTLLMEAVNSAARAESQETFSQATKLIRERIGESSITAWSGRFDRTLPQVLAMLRGEDWREV